MVGDYCDPIKVLVIQDQFEIGGAGRVISIACNELSSRGFDVYVKTDNKNWKILYPLDKSITILDLGIKRIKNPLLKPFKWLKVVNNIRKSIKDMNPNIIIANQAFMFFLVYLANLFQRTIVIACDHTSFSRKGSLFMNFIRFYLYSKADGLTILTNKDAKILGEKFPQKRVIYNPIPFQPQLNVNVKRKNILCAGRFDIWELKGFDIIIKIWSRLSITYTDWTLEIAGSGSEESLRKIENLISANGLQDRVKLLGYISDMQKLYQETSIFALPSRMEGFPMVLVEAMSQRCACISFSIGGACDEIIDEGINGFLIEDGNITLFENKLSVLLRNDKLRDTLAVGAVKKSSDFSKESFGDKWVEYINEVINKKNKQ